MTAAHRPVRRDDADNVAVITLDRPASMNALDTAMKIALRETLADVAADDTVRAVVLTGSGRAFCVGQDLAEHAQNLTDDPASVWSTVSEHFNPIVTALATMPQPVVAAVNGVAAGAGASLAFAADFRILADTAGFSTAFAGVGLSVDSGASWTLPRLVGYAKALELFLLPGTVPAAQAAELGLATRVVDASRVLSEAVELAARLARGPTVAYAAIRRTLAYSASHDLAESLAFEETQQLLAGSTEDHRAAVTSFLNKEKPVFHGR
ncbi:MAG: enoyl-CoA hydratase-related protein [Actinomycetes bacterium]